MSEMTLEIHANRAEKTCRVFRCAPAWGASPEPPRGFVWRGVLNNGLVRVRVGVYGDTLTLQEIQMIARLALTEASENVRR